MATGTPYLARLASTLSGFDEGRTIGTAADPETADEQDSPDARPLAAGHETPWLALFGASVDDADLSGKSIVTKMSAESSDEGDEDR